MWELIQKNTRSFTTALLRKYTRIQSVVFFLLFNVIYLNSEKTYAAPQTPSQALPKMFQKPPGLDYYEFKQQEKIIPALPEIQVKQQEDTGIKINLKSIIVLAPKELQNIISKNKYQEIVVGKPQSINDLYKIALEIEKDFNDKGFPLVRVILPIQELEPDQAVVFFKVIDGFIEKIDLSKVPKKQILRTYSYLKPLSIKKG